jgi:hypothetical protein
MKTVSFRAMAIHEHIRQDGEKELERDAMALLWSAIAAGLSMGASLLAKGIFMFIWQMCQADFYWKTSVHVRLCYRHYGPPATVYGEHCHGRASGDA